MLGEPGIVLAGHGPPTLDNLLELASDLVSQYTTLSAAYQNGARPLNAFVSELTSLHTSLQKHHEVTRLTGKEPPILGAIADILSRSYDTVKKHAHVLAHQKSHDPRRDSGAGWAILEQELATLRNAALQCSLQLKNLVFATVLKEALIETDTGSQQAYDLEDGSLSPAGAKLSVVMQGLARTWNLYSRPITSGNQLGQHVTDQNFDALEASKKSLLNRLLTFAGLESHPLEKLPLPELILECPNEYQRSVVSIGTLAVQRENDVPPQYYPSSAQDCKVTIQVPEHQVIQASQFQMFEECCLWLDGNGVPLLTHVFSRPTRERFPWKLGDGFHHPFTVSFTAYQTRGSQVKCYHGHRAVHRDQAPDYLFANETGYKLFQSFMRQRQFVEEYEVTTIKTKGHEITHTGEYQFIKVWLHGSDLTMTIPVTFSGFEIRNQELSLRWFETKNQGSAGLKLAFKKAAGTPSGSSPASNDSAASGSSKSFIRRLSVLVSPSSGPSVNDERDVAPETWTRRFDSFTVQFKDRQLRNDFAKRFKPGVSPMLPSSSVSTRTIPSINLTSPMLSPEEPPGNTPETSISRGDNPFTEIPTMNGTHPTGILLPEPLTHPLLRRGGLPSQPGSNALAQQDTGNQRSFYSPLAKDKDYVRLLRIDSGQAGTELSVSWEQHSLKEAPQYEALSYCWQKSGPTVTLTEGELQGFEVSQHVWNALRRLRHRDRPRFVWIDAICINQQDLLEKSRQIALMRQIYSHAFRTVIWIGDSRTDSPTCFRRELAEDDSQPTLCTLEGLPALEHGNASQDLRHDLLRLQENDDQNDLANVWWKRLWCIQEFHFSRRSPTVYLGPHAIAWKHFCSLFRSDANPLSLFHELRTPQTHSLFDLLAMTGLYRCTDPRDRIYALLGMAHLPADTITVDYERSVIQVIETACERLIIESGSVDVLLDGRTSRSAWGVGADRVVGVVPTWIPDLTCLLRKDAVKGRDNYNAGPGRAVATIADENLDKGVVAAEYDVPKTLRLRGVYFGKVLSRTRKSHISEYEHSPDNCVIYNSLRRRGGIIDKILEVLDYDFRPHELLARFKHLDSSPCIGRLFLHYLFDGTRSLVDEIKRRDEGPERDLVTSYERQEKEDLSYVNHEGSLADVSYVKERWQLKISRAESREIFIPKRIRAALDTRNPNIVQDFYIARDFENLFAYARHSEQRYYLTGTNFDAPMRKDVLRSKNLTEVKRLRTQYDSQARDLEFHQYNAKRREQDFFKTESGFLGLGPATLEEGDEIIIPFGSSRPWLVRKCSALGYENCHEFIGECYVPSIMAGQWMREEAENALFYHIR